MTLNYRRAGITYQVELYTEEGTSWEQSLKIRKDGNTLYAQMSSNLSHANSSYLRIRNDGTTYTILSSRDDLGGYLFSFGYNNQGQLGQGDIISRSTPTQIGLDTDWKSIAVTENYSLTIKSDGSLWSWGYNQYGQLGHGNRINRSSPTQVGSDTNWNLIGVGISHSLAIKNDGTLWAWGRNYHGALGIGVDAQAQDGRSSPVQVGSDTDWSQVSGGSLFSLALKTDGSLWSWGYNESGRLGLGDTADRSSPVQIGSDTDWSDISVGSFHCLVSKTDGTLWSWGVNDYGQLGHDDIISRSSPTQIGVDSTDWSLISIKANCSGSIKTDGSLWVWGDNEFGQLGQGDTINRSSPVQIGSDTNWNGIGYGYLHFLSTKVDGSLWACGYNLYGQLGQGHNLNRSSPVQIGSDTDWSLMSGSFHSLAIKQLPPATGQVFVMGRNFYGEFGNNDRESNISSPTQVGSDTDWALVYYPNENTHSFLIKSNGSLWTAGNNLRGQLGHGDIITRSSPTQVGSDTNWKQTSGGDQHSLAIRTDGTLWSWGYNQYRYLGRGDITSRSSPTQVGSDTDWEKLKTGKWHSIVLKTNGSLWSWGRNQYGEAGQGNTTLYSLPTQVGSDTNWSEVECGENFSLALKTDGTLWTWGVNTWGQLGHDDVISRSSPVQVGSDTDWNKLGIGTDHCLVIKDDRSLWSWGRNQYGQLGHDDIISRSSPTQIGVDSTDWSHVDGLVSDTAAIKTDGSLWTWGYNNLGQLGLDDRTARSSPVQVGSDTDWFSIYGGLSGFMALRFYEEPEPEPEQGSLYVFGRNYYGAFGYGDTTERSSPTQVGSETDWISLSYHRHHQIKVKNDGTLWSCGYNAYGELGLNDRTARSSPVQVGSDTDWAGCTNGENLSLLLKNDGTIWSCGRNQYGQLGLNTAGVLANESSPTQIGSDTDWVKINASETQAFAIKTDGSLWSWGYNIDGALGQNDTISRSSPVQVGSDTDWNIISSSWYHILSIKNNGTLWAWGRNNYGQLAQGDIINRSSPTQVGSDTNWEKVFCGSTYSFFIKTDGTLWSCGGISLYGELGHNDRFRSKSSPVQVGSDTNWNKIDITHGGTGVAGTKTDGTLWTWGQNTWGQLGRFVDTNRSVPTQVGSDSGWFVVAGGNIGFMVLRTEPEPEPELIEGSLFSFGSNSSGALGQNDIINRSSPVQVGSDTNWNQVSVGELTNLCIKSDGTLWSWGINTYGQLGHDDIISRSSPVQVGSDTDWNQVSINTYYHALGIKNDGTLWSWGRGSLGPLGHGDVIDRSTPTQVGLHTDWTQIAIGSSYSLALRSNGSLWAWGSNGSGRLGLNDTTARSSPVQVGSDTDWSFISTLNYTSLALKTDGTLWSWGDNSYGELGLGTGGIGTHRSSPTQIGSDTDWSQISNGINHSLAIKDDGTLWSWGMNFAGELGHDDTVFKSSPTQVSFGEDSTDWIQWSQITAGSELSFALKVDGSFWAWGDNTNGWLGIDDKINRSTPTQIGLDTDWKLISGGFYHTLAIKEQT